MSKRKDTTDSDDRSHQVDSAKRDGAIEDLINRIRAENSALRRLLNRMRHGKGDEEE